MKISDERMPQANAKNPSLSSPCARVVQCTTSGGSRDAECLSEAVVVPTMSGRSTTFTVRRLGRLHDWPRSPIRSDAIKERPRSAPASQTGRRCLTGNLRARGRVIGAAIYGVDLSLLPVRVVSDGGSAFMIRRVLRANPSSGNLHPTEGMRFCRRSIGSATRPRVPLRAQGARSRKAGDPDAKAWRDLCAPFPRVPSSWASRRSIAGTWKYGERAFRYCQHDAGHALQPGIAAAALGWAWCSSTGSATSHRWSLRAQRVRLRDGRAEEVGLSHCHTRSSVDASAASERADGSSIGQWCGGATAKPEHSVDWP